VSDGKYYISFGRSAPQKRKGDGRTNEKARELACEFNFEKMLPGLKENEDLLKGAGVKDIDELFEDVPAKVRIDSLDIPEGLVECELWSMMKKLLGANRTSRDMLSFLGAGIYPNYVPAVVKAVTSRGEFVTSYTPYQAEVSQGMLQALWEFQSLMCELTGMEATNTSMYDGPTAMGEAVLMAARITRRKEILVPKAMHWEKREVVRTYTLGPGLIIKEVPYIQGTGQLDLPALRSMVNDETAALVISNPNFFGVWEEAAAELKSMMGGALLIVDANPISLGIAKAPGDYGADIVVGEGQPLGIGPTLGGPSFGILTTKKKFLRDMPGRLIGMTKDADGARAFCMTLQTREQHIRRAKATSNICSNEALCSIAAAAYLSVLGRRGLRSLGIQLGLKSQKLAHRLARVPGIESPVFRSRQFNEFVLRSVKSIKAVCAHALRHQILPGVRLKQHFPELGDSLLVTVQEGHDDADFERLVAVFSEAVE
jgi:glycine dehydrogenase subunit 1